MVVHHPFILAPVTFGPADQPFDGGVHGLLQRDGVHRDRAHENAVREADKGIHGARLPAVEHKPHQSRIVHPGVDPGHGLADPCGYLDDEVGARRSVVLVTIGLSGHRGLGKALVGEVAGAELRLEEGHEGLAGKGGKIEALVGRDRTRR